MDKTNKFSFLLLPNVLDISEYQVPLPEIRLKRPSALSNYTGLPYSAPNALPGIDRRRACIPPILRISWYFTIYKILSHKSFSNLWDNSYTKLLKLIMKFHFADGQQTCTKVFNRPKISTVAPVSTWRNFPNQISYHLNLSCDCI